MPAKLLQQNKIIPKKGAGEKAFCAGGDIKDLTLPTYHGDYSGTFFFREEYQLDYQIATYSKPFIALMNGVVMGGGVGLSARMNIFWLF